MVEPRKRSTLSGQKAYRRLEGRFLRFDTYELTPLWKKTVEQGRWLSPKFALVLAFTTSWAALLGWWAHGGDDDLLMLASFCFGLTILSELTIHLRHVRNLALFRALRRGEGVEGTPKRRCGDPKKISRIIRQLQGPLKRASEFCQIPLLGCALRKCAFAP